jgi:vanillate O-demethylase ferredoxin subunit
MAFVIDSARRLGWTESHIHREYFAGTPTRSSDSTEFTVKIASTGATIAIPANQSVVAALATHGISIAVSCEQGVCGTCVTRLLEGVPDHRDLFFTDEEKAANDQFTPCCSRAKTPLLVLDI